MKWFFPTLTNSATLYHRMILDASKSNLVYNMNHRQWVSEGIQRVGYNTSKQEQLPQEYYRLIYYLLKALWIRTVKYLLL